MSCFYPLKGYQAPGGGPIVFNIRNGIPFLPVSVPCGQCIGCRLERSRQWAMRCMNEASLYDENCFITLTYAPDKLPEHGSLCKRDFQLFMKRLRKEIAPRVVRFYHCGEYGEQFGRPHYHAILFGFDFADKYPVGVRGDITVYGSILLQSLWSVGFSEIGSVTFESAAYVARYVLKKLTGGLSDHYLTVDEDTGEVHAREPPYTTMSRRPGIGRAWLDRYGSEVYSNDSVIVRGKEMKPPRYYDNVYEVVDPTLMESVCSERKRKRKREDETPERLEVREKCARSKLTFFKRGLE